MPARRILQFGRGGISRLLDLALALRRFDLRVRREARYKELDAGSRQNPDALEAIQLETTMALNEWLHAKLRRFPYWAGGHLAIGRLALAQRDVGAAYAAARCAIALGAKVRKLRVQGELLLARAYLSAGQMESAEAILARLYESAPPGARHPVKRAEIAEEYAAALFGLGQYGRALPVLEGIGESNLSAAARASLEQCRAKLATAPSERGAASGATARR